jgi:hypothetical protein
MKRMLALALAMSFALNLTVAAHGQPSLQRTPTGCCWPAGGGGSSGEGPPHYSSDLVDPSQWWMPKTPREDSSPPGAGLVRADSVGDELRAFWDWVVQSVRSFWERLNQETGRFVRRLQRDLLEPLVRILREAISSL